MLKKIFIFITIIAFVPMLCAQKSEKKKLEKQKDKEKNMSFLDYFNLIPKANRDYTSVAEFKQYEGLIIRDIHIKMFERNTAPLTRVENLYSTQKDESKSVKFNTKLVSKQLLFEIGDKVDPNILSDNERFIRENTIYTDAMIRVISDEDCVYADVYVFVQDNRHWRIAFEASPAGITIGSKAYDFLGVPQKIGVVAGGLFNPKNPYTVNGEYNVNNIKGSKINLYLDYTRQNFIQEPKVKLEREFVAYNTKWAAQADVSYTSQKVSENPNNNRDLEINSEYNLQYIQQDYWLAGSFPLKKINKKNKTTRFIIASRAFIKEHTKKPNPDKFPVQSFVDQQFYLGSIGIANRDWYGIEELYQFRQFDYVPKGANIAVMGGYEINEFLGNRWYSGLTANYNRFFDKFGYLQLEYRYGAFVRDKDYEQITTQISTQYFTKKYPAGRLKFRQFIGTTTTLSYNRPLTEFYSFNEEIKGLRSNYLFGTKSFVVNLEAVFHTNVHWWTSRGNFFFFADFGYVTQNDTESIFDNVLHQGYGGGIRFQHIATTIDYMEISLGFYPNGHIINSPVFGFNVTMQPSRLIKTNNLFEPGILTDIY